MTIGTMDIYLLVIIVASLVVGFFWGAARSVMLLAAWLLAFLAGAYLKLQLGSYLAKEWPNYSAHFADMAAFGIIYLGPAHRGAHPHRRLHEGRPARHPQPDPRRPRGRRLRDVRGHPGHRRRDHRLRRPST